MPTVNTFKGFKRTSPQGTGCRCQGCEVHEKMKECPMPLCPKDATVYDRIEKRLAQFL